MIDLVLLKYYLILLLGFITYCHSGVIINIRIYNYKNEDDVKHDGRKCETLHFFNDYCDPVFIICVTSERRCDILDQTIKHWRNKMMIQTVTTRTIKLDKIQKSFIVDVKVDDHDQSSYEHIAMFNAKFQSVELNYNYETTMQVIPKFANVHLYVGLIMQCEEKYFGRDCDKICEPKEFNYECNKNSGAKTCILDCGLHGNCSWDKPKDQYFCKCESFWKGEMCQFSDFQSCANIQCEKTCSYGQMYKYCTCNSDPTKKICQDIINITKTTIQPTKAISSETKNNIEILTKLITSRHSTKANHYTRTTGRKTATRTTGRRLDASTPGTKSDKSTLEKKSDSIYKDSTKSSQAAAALASPPPTTIIIIGLLLVLCICVISLSLIIRSWKNKDKKKGFFLKERPLPPVFYQPNYHHHTIEPPTTYIQNGKNSPISEYDLCTVQSDAPLIRFDCDDNKSDVNDNKSDVDPYEEPIINHMESLTCETFEGDNDSVQYEEPRNFH